MTPVIRASPFLFFLAKLYSRSPNLAILNNLHGLFFVFLGLIWIGWLANQSRLDLGLNLFLFYSRLFPDLLFCHGRQ